MAVRRRQRQAGGPLRSLQPAAFEVLPARHQEIVMLYYGLEDGEPLTSGEIADRLGVSADRVRQVVTQSVVRLLGPNAQRVLVQGRSAEPRNTLPPSGGA